MTALLILYTTLILLLSLHCSKNDIFSPAVITATIWVVFPLLYLIMSHDLPSLSSQVIIGIAIWTTGYCMSSLLMQSVLGNSKVSHKYTRANKTIRDFFLIVSIMSLVPLSLWIYNVISNGSGFWASDLRMAAIGVNKNIEPYESVFRIFAYISFFMELSFYDKKHKYRLIFALFSVLVYEFAAMSKTGFLLIFAGATAALYLTNKIKIKHILIGLIALLLFFIWFQAMRQGSEMGEDEKNDFLVLYMVGHLAAFDTVEPFTANHLGEHVFSVFYIIANKLGLSDIEPVNPILPFIKEPLVTNTYTVLYPFYVDFGYFGILFFSILEGAFFGFIYQKVKNGSIYALIIYAYCTIYIVTQFNGESLIYNILWIIKYCIIAAFPFIFTMKKPIVYNNSSLTNNGY